MIQHYSVLKALFEQWENAKMILEEAQEMDESERIISLREGTITGLERAIRCVMLQAGVRYDYGAVRSDSRLIHVWEQDEELDRDRITGHIIAKENVYTATYHGGHPAGSSNTGGVVATGETEDEAYFKAKELFHFGM